MLAAETQDVRQTSRHGHTWNVFPLVVEGSVEVSSDLAVEDVQEQLAHDLVKARASYVDHRAGELRFRAGLFRLVTSVNPLVSVQAGTFIIRDHHGALRVDYTLEFHQVVILGAIFGLFAALHMASAVGPAAVFVFLVVWLFLSGANIVFGIGCVRHLIRRAAHRAGSPTERQSRK
jgi:hypothetical protein